MPGSRPVLRGLAAMRLGLRMFEYGLSGKWLEPLKQIAPSVTRARDTGGSDGGGWSKMSDEPLAREREAEGGTCEWIRRFLLGFLR
jgi:hypothetical protein